MTLAFCAKAFMLIAIKQHKIALNNLPILKTSPLVQQTRCGLGRQ